ncbi:MAG TPA: hypothetical protein VKF32_11985 [Thermoanaerobaculia bacterium]|nr:hypothetical protein [Thermoanaerobaculia bacterium]
MDDEARYATLLEEAFIAERGTPFLLSPKDWTLIRSWRERGIPADTVIRAMKETFEKRRARGAAGKISSIAYCENAVDERWEMERRGLVGKNDGTKEAGLAPAGEGLARLVAALDDALARLGDPAARAAVERARQKIAALPPETPRDELEESLLSIEASMARALKRALPEGEAADLESHVAAELGEMPGVSSQVIERTRRALERRELRRSVGVPPLSLFEV